MPCAKRSGLPAPAELLPWDSEFWGFRIGRVTGERLTPELARAVDDWASAEAVRCVYLEAVDEPETVRLAGEHGWDLVEPRLRMTHARGTPLGLDHACGVPVRLRRREDDGALRDLARRTEYVTRFVFDQRFPRERLGDYHAAWIDFADAVLVVEDDGRLLGYITCKLPPEGVDAYLGIVAVDDAAKGGPVASALLVRAVEWCQAQGMDTVSVEVAARNVTTQRYVQRHGFRTSRFRLHYHRWYP